MTESTLSNYEITFILRPDLQEMEIEKLVTKIQNAIATRGGQIITSDNWGKQRLAYPIGQHEFGYYTTIVFTCPKNGIAEFEREIQLMPETIRHLIVSLDKEGIRPDQLRKINPFQEREYPTSTTRPSSYSRPAEEAKAVVSEKDEATRLKELDEKLGDILSEEQPE